MKTLKFRLIQMIVLCFFICLPDSVSAGISFSISFGSGPQYSRQSYQPSHKQDSRGSTHDNRNFKPVGSGFNQGGGHYRPQANTIITGPECWYGRQPNYCVIATMPRVIEKQVIVVQPRYDGSTDLLLDRLVMGNKWQRLEAIEQLAEFSFNDQVRYALENVLLSDPDPQLRKEVARIFGVMKNINALPALEKARVQDPDEDVRKEADNAIKEMGAN
jgi:hypothetical protein